MSDGVRISACDVGHLIIRLGIGGMFAFQHGLHKVETWLTKPVAVPGTPESMFNWESLEKLGGAMGQLGIHFWPTFWGFMAMSAEIGGGLLFFFGLLFRPACAMLAFTMTIATITMLHAKGLEGASPPIMAGAAIIGLLLAGPGKISLKHAIGPLRGKWYG